MFSVNQAGRLAGGLPGWLPSLPFCHFACCFMKSPVPWVPSTMVCWLSGWQECELCGCQVVGWWPCLIWQAWFLANCLNPKTVREGLPSYTDLWWTGLWAVRLAGWMGCLPIYQESFFNFVNMILCILIFNLFHNFRI